MNINIFLFKGVYDINIHNIYIYIYDTICNN